MQLLQLSTRNLFFTGKGGVGKTTVACAMAVHLADLGKKVLLVSTDPASNLDEVLGVALCNHPNAIPMVSNLWAMNIDPEQSASDYRERMVGPYRGLLPETAIRSMEEQFSGACTVEIAAFDEFARLLGDEEATAAFDHVVFDTAPTGHTLRLLTLPSAWEGYIQHNTSGTSCLGPLAGLQAHRAIYQATVQHLSDSKSTAVILVSRAETSALREAARTSAELSDLNIKNQHVVINAFFQARDNSDPVANAFENRGKDALASMPDALKSFPQTTIPLCPHGILGIAALRDFFSLEHLPDNNEIHFSSTDQSVNAALNTQSLGSLVDELVKTKHGVILTMGKGGVGKTTVAAAIAISLAQRGFEVHLSTTDPAAHLADALKHEQFPKLTVSRIDPARVTATYREQVLAVAGANLDEQGRALLHEDLQSPCTEEIAVFRAFAEVVAQGDNQFVVLDTAPTGHTILLLDAALAYHRELGRQSNEMPDAVKNLLPRLRDPEFTKILVVTLPDATPVHEAATLQKDLRRAEIEPYAWVVNQLFHSLNVKDPLLVQRKLYEERYLREVIEKHATRTITIDWQLVPPIGVEGLSHLVLDPIHESQ